MVVSLHVERAVVTRHHLPGTHIPACIVIQLDGGAFFRRARSTMGSSAFVKLSENVQSTR